MMRRRSYNVYETEAAGRYRGRRRARVRLLVAGVVVAGVTIGLVWTLHGRLGMGGADVDPPVYAGAGASAAPSGHDAYPRDAVTEEETHVGALTTSIRAASPTMTPAAAREAQRWASFAPINTSYAGVSMFRGNARRAFYGLGPVPFKPRELWHFPRDGVMSAPSSEGGKTVVWAGTGWTGQPVVVEWEGRTRVMFGAYDRALHFLDAGSGERFLPDLFTGDIIKGSVMFDPDGYPLLYSGSRDNYFRIVAIDREEATVLWKLSAYDVPNPTWNDDWDSSPVVIGDYLFEGGENSYFYIVKLNRAYGADGLVTVDPEVLLAYPAFDRKLFDAIGDNIVSIENSPAVFLDTKRGDRVYFANGGGRVVGLDIDVLGLSAAGYGPGGQAPGTWGGPAPVRSLPALPDDAEFPEVFRYWMGDDVDATLVLDEEGSLYVAAELERNLPRAAEVGQLVKLDPYTTADPLVWSVTDPPRGGVGGIWATPALHGDMLYVPTHTGRLLGVNRHTGEIVWEKPFSYHAWSSPVVVDDILLVGDAEGILHAYDVSDAVANPPQLWEVAVGAGGIESTPVVWKGRIYVGTRDGRFYCLGE